MVNLFFFRDMCVFKKITFLWIESLDIRLKPWQGYPLTGFSLNFSQDYRNHGIVSVSPSFFPFPLSSIIPLFPPFGIYKHYHVTGTVLGARDPKMKGYSLYSQGTKSSWWERRVKLLQYLLWSGQQSLSRGGDAWAGRIGERWQRNEIHLIWNINVFLAMTAFFIPKRAE